MTNAVSGLRPHRPGGRAHRRRAAASARRRRSRSPAPAPRSSAATSTRPRCEATADEITAAGGTARAVRDRRHPARPQVDALVDGAQAEFGRVDIMGNIAGIPHNKMVMDCTDDEFERILAINLKSCFYGCQAAMRVMAPQESGQHRQHLVGRDRHARADARLLRHDEGRGRDAHEDARLRGRAARDPGQRARARA